MAVEDVIAARLLDLVNLIDPPIRKRKLDNSTCVQEMMYMLKSGVPWSHLRPLVPVHVTTIYKRLSKWWSSDIFCRLWEACLAEYTTKKRLTEGRGALKTLFIDSTMIKNVSGRDEMGKNPSDRGRLATKMSIVCDDKKVPFSCTFYPANRNDCVTTEQSLQALKIKPRGYTIVGDKGYVSKFVAARLAVEGIKLLTPHKKNQRDVKLHSIAEKAQLKKRYVIENLFCRLDKFKRTQFRMDHWLRSYMAFTLTLPKNVTPDV